MNSKKSFSIASKPPASATSLKHKKAVTSVQGMSVIKETQNEKSISTSSAAVVSNGSRPPSSNLLNQISTTLLKKITEKATEEHKTPNKTK
jgi:hypothetical protein